MVHGSWQLLILVQVLSVYRAWFPWRMQYAVLALHVCVSTIHIPCVACTHIFLPLPYNSPCLSTTPPGIYVLYKKHMTQGVHYIIHNIGHRPCGYIYTLGRSTVNSRSHWSWSCKDQLLHLAVEGLTAPDPITLHFTGLSVGQWGWHGAVNGVSHCTVAM